METVTVGTHFVILTTQLLKSVLENFIQVMALLSTVHVAFPFHIIFMYVTVFGQQHSSLC